MKRNLIVELIILIICLSTANVVVAETESLSSDDSSYWSLQIENDVFVSSDDRFYTNGFQINKINRESPPQWLDNLSNKLPFFKQSELKGVGYSFGQKMFTPEDKTTKELIVDDRPYAGWLYASASNTAMLKDEVDFRDLNVLEFTVGILGPSSQADTAQNEYHQLIGVDEAEGWNNQLKDELGLVATYVRKKEYFNHLNNGLEYSWSPHHVFALGNVYTYAGTGMMFRFGDNLSNDIGPPNISPGFPGAAYFRPSKSGRSWYVFSGLETRAVARNIFLDGNTFKNSHSVDKKPLVFDMQFGVVYQHKNKRFSYSHVVRSKEFDGQKGVANFGSLNLSYFLD